MLTKFLTTVFILLNPLNFLFGQSSGQANFEQISLPPQPLPETNSLTIDFRPGLANIISGFVISAAQGTNPDFLPIRNWNVDEPKVKAEAALIFESDKDKILYQKNIEEVLPVASLTKLMTGLIVLENLDLDQVVTVSQKAVAAYGDNGGLVIDEEISVRSLLYILLMESSNDAAVALAEALEASENLRRFNLRRYEGLTFADLFTNLMNEKAEELGLSKTNFVEPTGYQPANLSTALDLAELVKYTLNQSLLWQILRTKTIDVSSIDNSVNHHLTNTNQLLGHWPNIIGGKTGYTEEAQGCLILVISQDLDKMRNYFDQDSSACLIIIVLGAEDRFLETEKLVNWVNQAYIW